MSNKVIGAAVALLLAGNAQALVTTPATAGGSEMIFMISNGLDGSEPNTAYVQDLGITRASFDFTQSQSWNLGATFTNVFLRTSEWQENAFNNGNCVSGTGLICGDRPTAGNGWFSSVLGWGVIAAERNTGGGSWVLSTFSGFNNSTQLGDGVTPGFVDEGLGDPVFTGADVLNNAIEMPDDDPNAAGTQNVQKQINEIPNHSTAGNNAALVELNGVNQTNGNITTVQLNNAGTNPNNAERQRYGGNAPGNYMATQLFNGFGAQASVLRPSATTDEQVTMYLFEEGLDGNGEIVGSAQGNGVAPGIWYLDFSGITGTGNQTTGIVVLRYEVAAVPVPAAVWLLASALLGMVGISRRRRGA